MAWSVISAANRVCLSLSWFVPLLIMAQVKSSWISNTAKLIALNEMPYAQARYTSGKGCLPDTWVTLLKEIYDILNDSDEDAPHVCLLTGVSGLSKFSVAHSVAWPYNGQKRLVLLCYFSSTDITRQDLHNMFSPTACDLCNHHDLHYKFMLWKTVEKN